MYKWTCIVQTCAVQGSTILFVRYQMEGCKDVCDFVIKLQENIPYQHLFSSELRIFSEWVSFPEVQGQIWGQSWLAMAKKTLRQKDPLKLPEQQRKGKGGQCFSTEMT